MRYVPKQTTLDDSKFRTIEFMMHDHLKEWMIEIMEMYDGVFIEEVEEWTKKHLESRLKAYQYGVSRRLDKILNESV